MKARKPTLNEKIAAWKQAYDIVLDELVSTARRIAALDTRRVSDDVWLAQHVALIVEASRTAALMAPWSVGEDD